MLRKPGRQFPCCCGYVSLFRTEELQGEWGEGELPAIFCGCDSVMTEN